MRKNPAFGQPIKMQYRDSHVDEEEDIHFPSIEGVGVSVILFFICLNFFFLIETIFILDALDLKCAKQGKGDRRRPPLLSLLVDLRPRTSERIAAEGYLDLRAYFTFFYIVRSMYWKSMRVIKKKVVKSRQTWSRFPCDEEGVPAIILRTMLAADTTGPPGATFFLLSFFQSSIDFFSVSERVCRQADIMTMYLVRYDVFVHHMMMTFLESSSPRSATGWFSTIMFSDPFRLQAQHFPLLLLPLWSCRVLYRMLLCSKIGSGRHVLFFFSRAPLLDRRRFVSWAWL